MKIKLSEEERAEMGSLAKLKAQPNSTDILNEINHWFERETAIARLGDPFMTFDALVATRRAFDVLARNGLPEFEPLMHEAQIGIDRIVSVCRRLVVRALLRGAISEPLAGQCIRELTKQINNGFYTEWRDDWDLAIEAAQCA
jgi:hypothetical protein